RTSSSDINCAISKMSSIACGGSSGSRGSGFSCGSFISGSLNGVTGYSKRNTEKSACPDTHRLAARTLLFSRAHRKNGRHSSLFFRPFLLPVLQNQPGHTTELGGIVRHQGHLIGQGDGCNHQIVRTNRRPFGCQICPYVSILLGGPVIKRKRREA